MTFNWKIPAVSAGGAFLLSLLVGIIGRVGFGTAILRGLLWALLFGVFAFGVDYLLRRFLPELFSSVEGEAADSERTIDITLAEENPLHEERGDVTEEIPSVDEPESRQVPGGDVTKDDASDESETSVEEDFGDDSEEVGELEQVDEVEALNDGANIATEETLAESGETEDDLPSFDGVETEFAAPGTEEQDAEQPAVSIDALGIEEDPATVARAVRTFMNKDQEG